ncbi:MAG: hypothetical protein J6Y94_05210, partial [Bacteriovoracaceae bacterium]|nr:hypothetical protein [Bacteriovoracaceae bacterium]
MTASPRALQRWAVRKIFLLILLGPALAGLALAATPRQEELDNFTRTFYLPKHFRGIAAEDAARALKYPRALADIFLDPTYAQKFAGPAEVENQLNLILNLIQGDKIRRNGILDFFNLQALEDHIIFRKAQIAWAYGRGIGARPEHFWAWQIIKAWLDPQRGTAHLTKFYQQVAALAAVGEMAMHYGPALPPPLAQYFLRQLATYLRHDDLGLRMMALSALSMLQGASAQALAHQTLRDPNWCRELSQKGNSKIGPILRFHFMGFALDAPAVRHNQDLLRDFYRLALDYFVFDECNYEFRIFAGEVAALEIAAATGTAGAQAMYNIALAHRDQSTEETYFSLSFQTSLLAYFNPDDDPSGAQNVLRQLQQLLQSPDAVEQILGAQAIIRHPFLEQQSIFAPQLRNLTWWQGVFAHLPSDIGSSFLLQKILRAMRFNPAGHTIQLLPELIMLHLKGTAGQAIRDHDYITLDETIFNLGNVLSRQKSLSFLTKILDGLLHWDGTWAGIKEDAATIKLNQSLAQLLGMAITTNLENPKTRQDCIDRMENYLKLKAAPDPYVQLMGLLLLERDPRPQAKAKLEFSLRHAKNIQQFFHAPSWWSSRGRFELFLRQYSFLLQREIPHTNHALAQRLAQDEETTGRRKNAGWAKTFKDAALPPAYPEEDRLNLSKPQHLALAKEI